MNNIAKISVLFCQKSVWFLECFVLMFVLEPVIIVMLAIVIFFYLNFSIKCCGE